MLNKDNTDEVPFIAVVDGDVSVRYPTKRLVNAFDVRVHGVSGLALQRDLNYSIPIIFFAAGAEENERVRAMQSGAVHFLRKPTDEQSLIKGIQTTLTPAPCLGPERPLAVNH